MDRRTKAREMAMQALYELDVQGKDLFEHLRGFLAEQDNDNTVRKLAFDWAKGTWENLADCDELITASTIRWDIGRLSFVDRSILRLAIYQLKFCDDIPPRVVINEAIEIAKKFSNDKSASFVNGVLDAVLKKLEAMSEEPAE